MSFESLLVSRITINTLAKDQPSTTYASGARKKTWIPKYVNVAARIVDNDSAKAPSFDRDGLQITHTVYVGGRAVTLEISQGDQIVYGTRVLEIVGVRNPDNLQQYLIIHCTEKTAGLATGWPTS